MKRAAVLFAAVWAIQAAEVPSNTTLEVRLTTPVSTKASHVKDVVEGILIAPVVIGSAIDIPAGAAISGFVSSVAPAAETTRATLKIQFTRLRANGTLINVVTRVSGVDNARETVDLFGVVQGINPKDTLTGRMDQGLGKLDNSSLAGLAHVLAAAKNFLIEDADPDIAYPAGTELTVRLVKPVGVKTVGLGPGTAPVPDDGRLAELVDHQPARTYAVHPDRPSDITNVMFIGSLEQVKQAFQEAGWSSASALNGASKWDTARAIIEQRGLKEAPVSVLLLDHRAPDVVLQKTNDTFSARHHIRIWRSPDTYQGRTVWLAAATHDTGIDFSEHEKTFIHRIDPNIDLERRKVANDLTLTGKVRGYTAVPRPDIPANFQNATGDHVYTDGAMAVLLF